MKKKFYLFYFLWVALLLPLCASATEPLGLKQAPQPSPCISGTFTRSGNSHWNTVTLRLKNNCGAAVDFQNATITFKNATNLNTKFWGGFGPLTYPDNDLQITSQPNAGGGFLATLSIHIPEDPGANSKLPNNKSIKIKYGTATPDYDPLSALVYLGTQPQTGEIDLTNNSDKPANVSQDFAVVDIRSNGQLIKSVQLPWKGTQKVLGLAPATYNIQPNSVNDSQGNMYQGTATPADINLSAGQIATSTITYSLVAQQGKIAIQSGPVPGAISGYSNTPIVTFTQTDTGATSTKAVPFNATTVMDQLINNKNYRFSTPDITFNNNKCTATFTPPEAVSNATPPTVTLSYACVPVNQVNATVNVNGLTSSTTAVDVTFTPNNGSAPVVKHVNLTNGSGTDTVQLTQGVIYNVSATNVSGFTATFNPQPLTAGTNSTETITYQPIPPPPTAGRTIGYLVGWKTPPTATALANAGYTNVLVAFGVFSTTTPGNIVPAFDTISKAYIASLKSAGIKVSLSIGGASTDLPNTSVNFHQVLTRASSPAAFQQTFVQSVKNLITQYGFDGIDINFEHGLNATGTIQNPTGDITALINIINQLHTDLPNLLISMVPETINIAATRIFSGENANYAAVIMKTAPAISWVGIQLYNSGCMLGIDQVCYDPNATNSPNFSVAMATDLLVDWPARDAQGRITNFIPYQSFLRPDQVVLGYPSPDSSGSGDAPPITPTATIKRAIQCLKTATAGTNSCGTYVPPKAFGLIGGVFNWEISFDQNNQYRFARDLKACVTTGNCA